MARIDGLDEVSDVPIETLPAVASTVTVPLLPPMAGVEALNPPPAVRSPATDTLPVVSMRRVPPFGCEEPPDSPCVLM